MHNKMSVIYSMNIFYMKMSNANKTVFYAARHVSSGIILWIIIIAPYAAIKILTQYII